MKNVLILGDSYSTFAGYIPEGYKTYYPAADVTDVSHTWWHRLATRLNLNLVEVNSWSGSTVAYAGREGDCSESSSFIYRFDCLARSGFLTESAVDTVLIFGATNDSWINTPIGEIKYDDITKEELYTTLPAICKLVTRVREELPEARIVSIVNYGLKPEIDAAFVDAAKRVGGEVVLLHEMERVTGHPTRRGMEEIADELYAALTK